MGLTRHRHVVRQSLIDRMEKILEKLDSNQAEADDSWKAEWKSLKILLEVEFGLRK